MLCKYISNVITTFAAAIAALAPAFVLAGLEAKSAVSLRLFFGRGAAHKTIDAKAILSPIFLRFNRNKSTKIRLKMGIFVVQNF
jgi:hypothetical protein